MICILIHGLGANRNHSAITGMAEILSSRGISILTFDLAGHGERMSGNRFDLRTHVQDIAAITSHFAKMFKRLILVGGSFGALTAALSALSDASVHGLVTINGFFLYGMPNNTYRNIYLKFRLSALFPTVYKQILRYARRSLQPEKISVPVLVLYADSDADVPVSESKVFYSALPDNKTLIEIPHANHDLTLPGNSATACNKIYDWLKITFNSEG